MRNSNPLVIIGLCSTMMAAALAMDAQDPDQTILLGGIQLELGMSQENALRKLSVVYTVTHMDNSPGGCPARC